MKYLEDFFSFYHLGLCFFILIISTYVLLFKTSITIKEEQEIIDFKVVFKEKIEYLQRFYHRVSETVKSKDMSVSLNNYQKLNFEVIEIVNTIQDIAIRYEDIGNDYGSLSLYYEILKVKNKIEPKNIGSIIDTWEKIMILNTRIGNKDEARKIFLYTLRIRGYPTPER